MGQINMLVTELKTHPVQLNVSAFANDDYFELQVR
jgi:hypothetical protein